MKLMKVGKIFLLLLLAGCGSEPEDEVDLDQMVLAEEERAEAILAGEPIASPQESLIEE